MVIFWPPLVNTENADCCVTAKPGVEHIGGSETDDDEAVAPMARDAVEENLSGLKRGDLLLPIQAELLELGAAHPRALSNWPAVLPLLREPVTLSSSSCLQDNKACCTAIGRRTGVKKQLVVASVR